MVTPLEQGRSIVCFLHCKWVYSHYILKFYSVSQMRVKAKYFSIESTYKCLCSTFISYEAVGYAFWIGLCLWRDMRFGCSFCKSVYWDYVGHSRHYLNYNKGYLLVKVWGRFTAPTPIFHFHPLLLFCGKKLFSFEILSFVLFQRPKKTMSNKYFFLRI